MGWQELGVAAIVGGALYYLARRLFARPRVKTLTSFVPLASLKKHKTSTSPQDAGPPRPG